MKPTLRQVTAEVRRANVAFDGPGEVGIARDGGDVRHHDGGDEAFATLCGFEYLPGDGARFDAVGAARRLLAARRDFWSSKTRWPL